MNMTIQKFRKQHKITLEELSKGCPEKGIKPLGFCVGFLSKLERNNTQGADFKISEESVNRIISYFKENYNIEVQLNPDILLPTRNSLFRENTQLKNKLARKEDEITQLKIQIRLYKNAIYDIHEAQLENLKKVEEYI